MKTTAKTTATGKEKAAATVIAALFLYGLLLLSAPLKADEVLMSRSGFENWLLQALLPRQQMLDHLEAVAQDLEGRLSAWELSNLNRIYLWPDQPVVEYYDPGGIPAGTGTLDVPAQIIDGRTVVPLRFLGEALGAEVEWDGINRQISYIAGDRRIVLTVGQKTVLADDRMVEIDTAPLIIRDRTMVPVRFVSQWLGALVKWDAGARRVEIAFLRNGSGSILSGTDLFGTDLSGGDPYQ